MSHQYLLTVDMHNVPRLRTYAGTTIEPLGRANVDVCHNSQQHRLPAIIVPGYGPNLLGRDWLAALKVNWATINVPGRQRRLPKTL